MKNNEALVVIVILNWNNLVDTLECLQTLKAIDYDNYTVVLVDNGSTDGSQEAILKHLKGHCQAINLKIIDKKDARPLNDEGGEEYQVEETLQDVNIISEKIHLILNPKNLGFSGGCNAGMVYALSELKPEYILLLNNDVRVTSGFLRPLVKVLESSQDAGIVGPKILSKDVGATRDIISFAGGSIDLRRGLAPHIGDGKMDDGSYDREIFVDYVEGSCMLIKAKTIIEVGLFSDRYFAYWEEADFCIRARNHGYQSVYCPSSKVRHEASSSTPSRVKVYLMARNRIIFEKENASKKQMTIFLAYFILWDFFKRIAILMIRRRDYDCLRAYIFGVSDALTNEKKHFDEMFMRD